MAPSPPPPPSKPGYGTLPPASAAPPTTTAPPQRRLVPGWAYLAAFVLLYSANNAVLALFMARGPPFTICGIMCVGNFLGCASLYPVFFRQITLKNVRKVTPAQWGWMLLGCLLANVLGSVAYLQGLKLTSVSARAMTGRLESVDFLVAAAVFLGHTTSAWVGANALLTVVGVVLAVLYPLLAAGGQADPHSLVGYLYLVAGGWGYTLSLVITKRYLVHIPVGLLSLFKLALGTVLFHVLAELQRPASGMMALYSWPLWRAMLWYAPFFVTSTMVLWLRALKLCSPAVLSIGMNSNFVVTIIFGILIVNKWPTPAEYIGGGFILVSILSGIAETVVHGAADGAKEEEGRLPGAAQEAPKQGWPLAQPAVGVGMEGAAAEGELARLVPPPPHKTNHLGYEALEEGVGLHPFT